MSILMASNRRTQTQAELDKSSATLKVANELVNHMVSEGFSPNDWDRIQHEVSNVIDDRTKLVWAQ
jgi:hypothetical protein